MSVSVSVSLSVEIDDESNDLLFSKDSYIILGNDDMTMTKMTAIMMIMAMMAM